MVTKKNGPNPCKTLPGQQRYVEYQAYYASAAAAHFANVSKATIYRALREKQLPSRQVGESNYPQIEHPALLAWMAARGFPVPSPRRRERTAPALAAPLPSVTPQTQAHGEFREEPCADVLVEVESSTDSVYLRLSGWCAEYSADPEGWLANVDGAVEEATVSAGFNAAEARAIAAVLIRAAERLDHPLTTAPKGPGPVSQDGKLLTLDEAARQLGLPRNTLLNAVKAGALAGYRVGSGYRVAQPDVALWLASLRVAATE